jgi:hypothetical protein
MAAGGGGEQVEHGAGRGGVQVQFLGHIADARRRQGLVAAGAVGEGHAGEGAAAAAVAFGDAVVGGPGQGGLRGGHRPG